MSGTDTLAVLLDVGVRNRHAVDDDQTGGGAATRASVRSHRDADPVLELWIEIALEEIGRLHDVHIGIDEPKAVFHQILLALTFAGELCRELWSGEGAESSEGSGSEHRFHETSEQHSEEHQHAGDAEQRQPLSAKHQAGVERGQRNDACAHEEHDSSREPEVHLAQVYGKTRAPA